MHALHHSTQTNKSSERMQGSITSIIRWLYDEGVVVCKSPPPTTRARARTNRTTWCMFPLLEQHPAYVVHIVAPLPCSLRFSIFLFLNTISCIHGSLHWLRGGVKRRVRSTIMCLPGGAKDGAWYTWKWRHHSPYLNFHFYYELSMKQSFDSCLSVFVW